MKINFLSYAFLFIIYENEILKLIYEQKLNVEIKFIYIK